MIVDDDDNVHFEFPDERVTYRRYQELQDRARSLRRCPTWPARQTEFEQVLQDAEVIYASLANNS